MTKNVKVLAEDQGEWQTKQVIRIAGSYYYRRLNGGSRGAYDHRTNPDVFETRSIDCAEARRLLVDLGLDPETVAQLTSSGSRV